MVCFGTLSPHVTIYLGHDVFSFFFSMEPLPTFSLMRIQYRGSIIGLVVCSLRTCDMKLSCTFQAIFFSEHGSEPVDKFIYFFSDFHGFQIKPLKCEYNGSDWSLLSEYIFVLIICLHIYKPCFVKTIF